MGNDMARRNELVWEWCGGDFDARSVERGITYARQGRVSGLKMERQPQQIVLRANVRGSEWEPYETTVEVDLEGGRACEVVTECSCPVGVQCKHGVAVLAEALGRKDLPLAGLAWLGSEEDVATLDEGELDEVQPGRVNNKGRAKAEVVPPLSWELQNWLDQWRLAAAPPMQPLNKERVLYALTMKKNQYVGGHAPLEVACYRQMERREGRWDKPRKLGTSAGGFDPEAVFPPQEDRTLIRRIELQTRGRSTWELKDGALLADLVATGRCYWRGTTRLLTLGSARRAEAAWEMDETGAQHMRLKLEGGGELLPTWPLWYVDEGPDGKSLSPVLGPVETKLNRAAMEAIRTAPTVQPQWAGTINERLREMAGGASGAGKRALPGVGVGPPALAEVTVVEEKPVKPVGVLRLYSRDFKVPDYDWGRAKETQRWSAMQVEFDYGGRRVAAKEFGLNLQWVEKGPVARVRRIQRNVETEQKMLKGLRRAGLNFLSYKLYSTNLDSCGEDMTLDHPDHWMDFVMRDLPGLERSGWRVEFDDSFDFKPAEAEGWYTDAEGTGQDWFDVELGVLVDGERINLLPMLHQFLSRQRDPQALRGQDLALRLPDGRMLRVDHARVKAIMAALVELFDPEDLGAGDRLRVSKLRAADLAQLEGWEWKGNEALAALGQKIKGFGGIGLAEPPEGLLAELRPYQREGLSWLQFLREYGLSGILADDMGLGKTVQALAHILSEKRSGRADRPSLVVAPTSLMNTWRREAERFAPDLKVLISHGLERKERFEKISEHDVVVTSYPLLPRDEEVLLKHEYHVLILDEAQYIKNPRTKWAETARKLKARHRLCMTGTPMENHLGELWSLMSFLLPGFLGSEKQFRRLFRTPIEKFGDTERRDELARRVRPFMLRRKKEDVVKELPAKTEIVRTVDLAGAQRDLYESIRIAMHDRVRAEIAAKGMARSQIVILDALLKLRQVCCDPRLVKLNAAKKVEESAKLELLMDLLPELVTEGRRVLLFSQFTSMLDLIEPELEKREIEFVRLTGQTTDRATPVERFQAGDVPVFLISLKAGGTGLTLTAADTVIHYDPWWNPAVENQATDRAHRIGQDKKVFVYKLVTAGTVEEKIVALQQKKAALVEGLLAGGAGKGLELTKEELEGLFAPLK